MNKLALAVTVGRSTREEAIEQVRKSLVYCMRSGERLVLQCGKSAVDFKKSFDSPDFPVDIVFNYNEWRKEENYMKIVREDENHDLMGNKRCYIMNKDFDIILLLENDDDPDTKALFKANLGTNLKNFDIINID